MESLWMSSFGGAVTNDADIAEMDHHIRQKRYVVSQGLMEQSRVDALYIIFIIFIFLINVFLIVVILMSKTMRPISRNLLIINVCIGDLIMGIFVLPVLLNLGLRSAEDGEPDCSTFHAMRIFADFLIPSVTTLAVLSLNIDYVLRLCCSVYSEGISRLLIVASLFAIPWVVSCCIIIPIYTNGLDSNQTKIIGRTDSGCSFVLDPSSTRTLLIVSFFPQAFLLLVFNIIVSVMYLINRESFGLDVCGERIRAPVDICLASFATLVLYTPVFLITLLTTEHYLFCTDKTECSALYTLYTIAIWALFSKSWVLSFSWFTCRDTRACIGQVLRC